MSTDLRRLLTVVLTLWLAACATPAMPTVSPTLRPEAEPPTKVEAPGANGQASATDPSTGVAEVPSAPTNAEQAGVATTAPEAAATTPSDAKPFAQGLASWYARKFQGRRTASGERYDRHALTAAHRSLPFGTRVRVRSTHTGKEVVVRINDRGPFVRGRIIDLSESAFDQLGLRHRGVTAVELLPE